MSAQPAGAGSFDQHNDAQQYGRVFAVQHGDQHVHLTMAAERAEEAVTVAPPLGRRNPSSPLRGRGDLVDSLWSTMRAPAGVPRVRVLCGLAGSGKTAIALETAHRAACEGIDVWWVDGSAEHLITGGLLAVARQAGVQPELLRHGDAADQLWRSLLGRSAPWLLVVDNVDRPHLLAGGGVLADGTGWLRPVTGGAGMVVVTTRDGDRSTWGPWCVLDPVGMLATADAADVLIDLAGGAGSVDTARTLAARLGGLPLALHMAASYLADTAAVPWPEPGAATTFDGYLAAIGTADGSIGEPDGVPVGAGPDSATDRHQQMIDRLWELSLDLLTERGLEQARPLLRVLSSFADAPLPYRLLLNPQVLADAPAFERLTASRLWRLITDVAALGLVDVTEPDGADPHLATARVHPLVRQASCRHGHDLTTDHPAVAARLMIRAVDSGALGLPHDPVAWPRWQAVTAHALHLADRLTDRPDPGTDAPRVLACAIDAVRHLRARGLFELAELNYRRLDEIGDRVLPAGHPHRALIRHELAYTIYYRGSVAAAGREFAAALVMRRDALGPNHPDTLTTLQAMGRVARNLGRYEEARALLTTVHVIQRDLLGPDHPDTLTTHHQLARAMLSLGEVERARAEFQTVLWRRRRTLAPLHPDTLMTRHQLGSVAYRQGRYRAAERVARVVGELRRQTLGEHHPDTLHSRHWLGLSLAAQGHTEAAEAELRHVLDVRSRVFGERHPDTLTTRHLLAGVMARDGRRGEAVAEYRTALDGRRQILGDDHPDTRLTATRLTELSRSESQPR